MVIFPIMPVKGDISSPKPNGYTSSYKLVLGISQPVLSGFLSSEMRDLFFLGSECRVQSTKFSVQRAECWAWTTLRLTETQHDSPNETQSVCVVQVLIFVIFYFSVPSFLPLSPWNDSSSRVSSWFHCLSCFQGRPHDNSLVERCSTFPLFSESGA